MQAREAAQWVINAICPVDRHQNGVPMVTLLGCHTKDLEDLILSAISLAGCGWRDIAEAKKDGTVYKLYYPTLEGSQRDGYWSVTQNEWRPLSYCPAFSTHQPTKFHEMPSDPREEGEGQ